MIRSTEKTGILSSATLGRASYLLGSVRRGGGFLGGKRLEKEAPGVAGADGVAAVRDGGKLLQHCFWLAQQ